MGKLPVPQARKKDLIIEELPNERLVYDWKNNRAHCLNQTTATSFLARQLTLSRREE
ncbi:MAG: hypothetical protein M3R69_13215 [Acidobacteriota bacterium]|nr:hypothetical protein [Acidobacteriota bacterium]